MVFSFLCSLAGMAHEEDIQVQAQPRQDARSAYLKALTHMQDCIPLLQEAEKCAEELQLPKAAQRLLTTKQQLLRLDATLKGEDAVLLSRPEEAQPDRNSFYEAMTERAEAAKVLARWRLRSEGAEDLRRLVENGFFSNVALGMWWMVSDPLYAMLGPKNEEDEPEVELMDEWSDEEEEKEGEEEGKEHIDCSPHAATAPVESGAASSSAETTDS